jgi:signal transduction histidine kinase
LRTPLSIITLLAGNLDALYERLDESRKRKLIRDIRSHIQVLNDLITNVLEVSRLDGGRLSKDFVAVNLAEITREEVEKQLPLAKDKHQNLIMNGTDPLEVQGHESQLRQVVRNLINNAIKYTPRGGYIACSCEFIEGVPGSEDEWPGFSGQADRRWAVLRVRDTGIGIEQEDIQHLFERFYRVSTQGNIPGAGLGLSIAKDLIDLHNGHMTVASTPREGSMFTVYLPLEEG